MQHFKAFVAAVIIFSVSLLPQAAMPLTWGDTDTQAALTQSHASVANAAVAQRITALEMYLSKYERLAAEGGWPVFTPGAKLEIGDSSPRVATARQILALTTDYAAETTQPELYDQALADAVTRFQERHALDADGVMGKKTQIALAVPIEQRIAQIRATLERMRADQIAESERLVIVNVPGFYLEGIANNTPALRSRIIVGTPRNSTPMLAREITHVNFNPQWNVPHSIATKEMLVKAKEDPEYFQKSGYRVIDTSGEEPQSIDPATVDWTQVAAADFNYRIKQPAGDGNALGKIKFTLPDSSNIYLHSTSSPKLFAKAERALSHGCVRVEQARQLAYFVMAGAENWSNEKIDRFYDGSATRTISIEPVPVYLVYWAVWTDESGAIHFNPDIYRRDASRVAELMNQSTVKLASN